MMRLKMMLKWRTSCARASEAGRWALGGLCGTALTEQRGSDCRADEDQRAAAANGAGAARRAASGGVGRLTGPAGQTTHGLDSVLLAGRLLDRAAGFAVQVYEYQIHRGSALRGLGACLLPGLPAGRPRAATRLALPQKQATRAR